MKFFGVEYKMDDLIYMSTAPILLVGGGALVIYGLVTGDNRTLSEAGALLGLGSILELRSRYTRENIKSLNHRISQLEEKLKK